jgi:hypothetical protein
MKKPRTAGKRGTKPARVKDLSAERSTAKGGASYTMFLPDGTPVRTAQTPPTQARSATSMEPTSMEYPN